MDMGKAFIHWVKEHLPSAQIVFDHFHVIKLMNEKLDLVRRRIAAKLDAEERAILKNQRFTLLRNEENLSSEATAYLAKIKQTFQELADVHMMKEALRSIYSVAQNVSQAEDALFRWVKAAQKIQSDQLHKMAKTILQHWDGILGFWRFGNMTNASMEGFNNKVGQCFDRHMDIEILNTCASRFSICRTTISKLSFEASFTQTAEEAKK